MATCVFLVPGGGLADPAVLGGKGVGVARLIAERFPVPPTAVVTTAAYQAAIAAPQLQPLVTTLLSVAGDVSADAVDAAFLASPLPPALEDEIVAAARRVGGGHPLAVRSSATVEDLAAASSAGQYRSVLNVAPEEVLRAVRLVWASLWHPAPRAYRRAQGLNGESVQMAVLLMRMVPAVRAGVAFTLDPAQTAPAVRIEAVDGLGEALVSGAVRPSAWTAPHSDVVDALRAAPAPIPQVAALALDLERALAAPQDIEWAWDGLDLWLLQTRPITTLGNGRGDGFDTTMDQAELTTAGIAETLPGVLPPLVWQVASFTVEEALRRVLDDLGALDESSWQQGFIRRVRGRAVLNMDRLRRAAGFLPHGSADEIERQYFGTGASVAPDGLRPRSVWQRIRAQMHDLRVLRARRRAILDADIVAVAAAEVEARRPDPATLDHAALLAYRNRLIDLGTRAAAAELGVAAGAGATYERLEAMLRRYLGGDGPAASRWAQYVTTGAGVADVSPQASMAVFAGPTWAECGVPVPDLTLGRTPPSQSEPLGELEAVLTGRPRWRRIRLLTGQLVDVRIHLLRRTAADAVAMLGRRERTKAAVLRIGGEVRRITMELGRRLAASGVLPAPSDVDLLNDVELRGERVPPPAELDRRRRWLRHYTEYGLLPERFVGYPLSERSDGTPGKVFRGSAASGGRYTGTARFVHSPRDGIEAGAVLLADSTDASWSTLFLRAGAIVVANGGPLSHAAIVAREFGLPAVVGVAATLAMLDGRPVTVDGDRGTVTVHDRRGHT